MPTRSPETSFFEQAQAPSSWVPVDRSTAPGVFGAARMIPLDSSPRGDTQADDAGSSDAKPTTNADGSVTLAVTEWQILGPSNAAKQTESSPPRPTPLRGSPHGSKENPNFRVLKLANPAKNADAVATVVVAAARRPSR